MNKHTQTIIWLATLVCTLVVSTSAGIRRHNIPISAIPVVVHPDNQEFFVNTDMLRKIKYPEDKITELENNSSIKVVRAWIDSPDYK